jgi:3-oxoacyl-[acyl-carrier-protein] synthase II
MQSKERVFITAFGAITPLGSSFQEIDYHLKNNISGIKKIEKFSCDSFLTYHAGIPNEGNEYIRWPAKKPINGEVFYSRLSMQNLLKDQNFPHNFYDPYRLGCIVGVDEPFLDLSIVNKMFSCYSKEHLNKNDTLELMSKYFKMQDFLSLEPSIVLSEIYSQFPFHGISLCHMGLCSASLQAIGMGYQYLQNNILDAIIVGGVSGKVTPMNLARLELMNVISTDTHLNPDLRSRPFDARRSGFVLAEGAVLFLLEKESNILQRKATTLIEILGYGSSLGAEHIVTPHSTSLEMSLSMSRALFDANITSDKIDLINAHGTSTVLNDKHESQAINKVFENRNVKVTANKSFHGHLIAAAGAMEILNTIISSKGGYVPATINLENQDSSCNINLISKLLNDNNVEFILKNSFGMGGLAASMILRT